MVKSDLSYLTYIIFQEGCDLLLAMDNFDPPPINIDYMKLLEAKQGCPVNRKECMAEIRMYNKLYKLYHSCSICGRLFANRNSRNRHTRQVDCANKVLKVLKFKCRVCERSFSARSSRDRHQRTQHRKKSKKSGMAHR